MNAALARGAADAFLARLIDDAGLFPPSQLAMPDALARNRAARAGPRRKLLNRFVCPASRLGEICAALPEMEPPLEISLLLDANAREALAAANGRVRVGAFEARWSPETRGYEDAVAELLKASGATPHVADAEIFIEIPPGVEDLEAAIEAIAAARAACRGADVRPALKMRCGGVTADAVPSPARLARHIAGAARHGLPLKATAGLHHPVRHFNREAGFTMHGFLNVVGAALLAASLPLPQPALEAMLADEDAGAFTLNETTFAWRQHALDATTIARGRITAFTSYGSCSLQEPVEGLLALGIPVRAAS